MHASGAVTIGLHKERQSTGDGHDIFSAISWLHRIPLYEECIGNLRVEIIRKPLRVLNFVLCCWHAPPAGIDYSWLRPDRISGAVLRYYLGHAAP